MLNQMINVFWTLISFTVVGRFWGRYFAEGGSIWPLYIILVASILTYKVPAKWLLALTLSSDRRTYEALGVKTIRWFVQNGTLVARIKQRIGSSKHERIITRQSIEAYLKNIVIQERFHYSCFVFFTFSTFSALSTGKIGMALSITFWNILYNIYPVLLQQYNRLRIQSLISRPCINKIS